MNFSNFRILGLVLLASVGLVAQLAQAQVVTLPQLDSSQIDPLFKDLSADLAFRPVEGAAPLDLVGGFGVSAGASVIATSTSSISSIIGSSPQYIPGMFIDTNVGLPYNLGIEFGFAPSISLNGTSFSDYGGDIRWNFGKYIPALPIDLTARAMLTSASISSDQALSGTTINVHYHTFIEGLHVTAGKTFLGIFEPYVGLGFVNESSDLSYSGSASLFNTSFATGTTDVSGSGLGFWGTAGLQVRLLFLQFGGEYATMWGNSTYAVKVALRF